MLIYKKYYLYLFFLFILLAIQACTTLGLSGKHNHWTAPKSTVVYVIPDFESKQLYVTQKPHDFIVIKVDNGWVAVLDEIGSIGWIYDKTVQQPKSKQVKTEETTAKFDAVSEPISEPEPDIEEPPQKVAQNKPKKTRNFDFVANNSKSKLFNLRIDANMEMLFKNQDFSSSGTTNRGNYTLPSTAPVLRLNAILGKTFGNFTIGTEVSYFHSLKGQIKVPGDESNSLTWNTNGFDLRAIGAYQITPSLSFSGRFGYNYHLTEIEQDSVMMLPSELINGYILGGGISVDINPVFIDAGFESLLSDALLQSEGMHDGDTVDVKGNHFYISLNYAWKQTLEFVVRYALNFETYEFTGSSDRNSDISEAVRKDKLHIAGFGFKYRF